MAGRHCTGQSVESFGEHSLFILRIQQCLIDSSTEFEHPLWRSRTNSGSNHQSEIFPVLLEDPIFHAWTEKLTDLVINELDANKVAWMSVDILRTGWSRCWHENPVTVLIGVPDTLPRIPALEQISPAAERNVLNLCLGHLPMEWQAWTEPATLEGPKHRGLHMIEVKSVVTEISRLVHYKTRQDCPVSTKYQLPTSGDTISVGSGETVRNGTVGCFLNLTVSGTTSLYGLTCHHVVSENDVAVDTDSANRNVYLSFVLAQN